MRKLGVLLLGAALAMGGFTVAREYQAIKKSGTIRIATEGAFPPYNFMVGRQLTGFEYDLGNAIAKKMGLKAEWVTLPFDSLLIGLDQERFDFVIASHGITPERQKKVDFARPHYCTGGVIVSKAGGPKTAADLAGKTVAVQVGTTYLENVRKVAGVREVKTFQKDTDAQQNLVSGRVDAWVTDKGVAGYASKRNPKAGLVLGDELFTEKVAIAVRKNNSSLLGAINSALIGLENDGGYKAISERWFGVDVSCKS